jgi:DNA-binding IclR family transcriptional regulator
MRDPVKSAVRAFEVLELFAKVRRPLAQHEIVSRLAYPQSSSTKLLKSIVDRGYLQYDRAERTYFPTLKLHGLGEYLRSNVDETLTRIASSLHAFCGETIMIANQNDLYVQYIKVLESIHAIRFNIPENSMRPLVESSLGWMLLSTQDDRKIEQIYKQSLAVGVRSPVRSCADLIKRIERCREEKYCYVRGMPLVGGGAISMLLPTTHSTQPLVISVGGVCDRLEASIQPLLSEMRRLVAGAPGKAA